MFSGSIVWRGIIYSILMMIGKLATGVWLVRISFPWSSLDFLIPTRYKLPNASKNGNGRARDSPVGTSKDEHMLHNLGQRSPVGPDSATAQIGLKTISNTNRPAPAKPLSLYPPAILGLAMTARGEIGFLIASIAESQGIFSNISNPSGPTGSSQIYLVVVWAIVLCTMLGPLGVGLLVRRVKRLESSGGSKRGGVLGVWGVDAMSGS
jgi:hypothetical protein